MKKAVQAKHITDEAALTAVRELSVQSSSFWKVRKGEERWVMVDELEAKLGHCNKVVRAKMKALIKRGLLGGCWCGCRGDFHLTDKGREHLMMYATELVGQWRQG